MSSPSTATALPSSSTGRPGRVKELRGIIFQCDEGSILGSWFIRPIEMLDLRMAGLGRSPGNPSLAMHVGLHVGIEDGGEFVVEQLCETPHDQFVDGQNWTPIESFRARDRGGWDVTVPATAFRQIDDEIVNEAVEYLNLIQGRPFVSEDCVMLVERAFGKRRMFADSPLAGSFGFDLRVGEPALPLLRPEARLDRKAERLLRAAILRALPKAVTEWDAPNALFIARKLAGFLLVFAPLAALIFYRRKRQEIHGVR